MSRRKSISAAWDGNDHAETPSATAISRNLMSHFLCGRAALWGLPRIRNYPGKQNPFLRLLQMERSALPASVRLNSPRGRSIVYIWCFRNDATDRGDPAGRRGV